MSADNMLLQIASNSEYQRSALRSLFHSKYFEEYRSLIYYLHSGKSCDFRLKTRNKVASNEVTAGCLAI